MIHSTQVNDTLRSLGQRDNITGLELNQYGCIGLQLRDRSTLSFEWNERQETLFIYTRALNLVSYDQEVESLYETLLTFNCLSIGCVFSVSKPSQDVIIHQSIPLKVLTVDYLDKAIEQIISSRIQLNEYLQFRGSHAERESLSQSVFP